MEELLYCIYQIMHGAWEWGKRYFPSPQGESNYLSPFPSLRALCDIIHVTIGLPEVCILEESLLIISANVDYN